MAKIDELLSSLVVAQDKLAEARDNQQAVYAGEVDGLRNKRNDAVAAVLKYVTELETMFDALSAKQEEIDALQHRVAELEKDRDDIIERLR